MKAKAISLFLGLSALVCLTDARAVTIAENTAGLTTVLSGPALGQSFTTVAGSPTSNVAFNFFSDVPATTPLAAGDGFLLSMEYLGTPAGLNSSTPGFLGQTTASGGFYTFGPSLTLLPNTQYFFYENVLIAEISGGNIDYVGGSAYLALVTGRPGSGSYLPVGSPTLSLNFRVTGTPVAPSVPDNGSTAMLLGIGVVAIAFASRCRFVVR
jgi:hypothetical protein